MNKNEVLKLTKYIDVEVTNHGRSTMCYLTNNKPYKEGTLETTALYDLSLLNNKTYVGQLKGDNLKRLKIENKEIEYAMCYLLVLKDAFNKNDLATNERFKYDAKELVNIYNSSLEDGKSATEFYRHTFNEIISPYDDICLHFFLAKRFKQLPEEKQEESIDKLINTCEAIDSAVNKNNLNEADIQK